MLIYAGQIPNAVPESICSLAASVIASPRKSARFRSISGIPGPGQSVPNKVFAAISSSRGKYFNKDFGGIPEISKYTFACRRTYPNRKSWP